MESSSSFANINFNKTKIYENFVNFKNIANINLLKCYKVLFSVGGIKKNYGSLSLIPLLLIHFIIIILFYAKNLYQKIEMKIKDISFGIKNWDLVKKEERKKERLKKLEREKESSKKFKKKELKLKKEENKKKKTIYEELNIKPPLYLQYREIMGLSNIAPPVYFEYKNYIDQIDLKPSDYNPPIKKIRNNKKNKSKNIINDNNRNFLNINKKRKGNLIITNGSNRKFKRQTFPTVSKDKVLKRTKEIMAFNDEELNNLEYELALKYDHRTYCEYYISLLRIKHIIMFTFFNNTDYNSKIIKVDLFLFNFSLYYAVNTLFFNDNTMHQIYEDEGSFNFIYQLP